MEELISVIVPVYNVEKFIDKCIDSIINQSYSKLEIIIIDDGSIDSSGKKCDKWAQKDSRIKVIHQNNKGVAETRNVGILHANGKYISFVDPDDYIDTEMIEKLYNALVQTNSQISICNFKHIKNNKNTKVTEETKVFSKEEAIVNLLLEKNINSYFINKLILKDLFTRN